MTNYIIKTDEARTFHFASFYEFRELSSPQTFKEVLELRAAELGLIGLIILAKEGINGTIAGSRSSVEAFVNLLNENDDFTSLEVKYSEARLSRRPYRRFKVKVKKEIVTMGIPQLDVNRQRGRYVEPRDWNALIRDPEVLLIDARNVYEYRLGTFQGAKDPLTLNFRQFPASIQSMIAKKKPKKVAMFCTGGIRCEKASSYVRSLGIDEVYHLKGGILHYFEVIPREESAWNGSCFVFDGRITVDQDLAARPEPLCTACGQVMIKIPDSEEYECHQCRDYPVMHNGTKYGADCAENN